MHYKVSTLWSTLPSGGFKSKTHMLSQQFFSWGRGTHGAICDCKSNSTNVYVDPCYSPYWRTMYPKVLRNFILRAIVCVAYRIDVMLSHPKIAQAHILSCLEVCTVSSNTWQSHDQ